jgi:phosphate transport system substrate-binding protein
VWFGCPTVRQHAADERQFRPKKTTGGSPATGGAKPTGTIDIDGSSTVYRLTAGAYEMFQEVQPDVQITVNYSGTGGGFKKFLDGKLDIADARGRSNKARSISPRRRGSNTSSCPSPFDALTVAVNAGNDWASEITVDELKSCGSPRRRTRSPSGSQIRSDWPDKEIKLVGAGHDSGTFEYSPRRSSAKKGSERSDATGDRR